MKISKQLALIALMTSFQAVFAGPKKADVPDFEQDSIYKLHEGKLKHVSAPAKTEQEEAFLRDNLYPALDAAVGYSEAAIKQYLNDVKRYMNKAAELGLDKGQAIITLLGGLKNEAKNNVLGWQAAYKRQHAIAGISEDGIRTYKEVYNDISRDLRENLDEIDEIFENLKH